MSKFALEDAQSEGLLQPSKFALSAAVTGLLVVFLCSGGEAWAAEQAGAGGGDFFEPVISFNASIISGLAGIVGSGGLAIVLYTLLVKVITYPLSQSTVRTNVLLEMVSPQIRVIEARYKNDEGQRNELLRNLYLDLGVNPLSSFFPVIVQLPVFIALFRAIGRLAAQEPRFSEAFLWIPNLAGPCVSGQPSLDWLLRSQTPQTFEPLVGWQTALLYLVTPILVASTQYLTGRIGNPRADEQGVLGLLFPTFIGISTLVSPQGLGLYWLTNSILTGVQTKVTRDQVGEEFPQYRQVAEGVEDGVASDGLRYTRDSPFSAMESQAVEESIKKLKPQKAAGKKTRKQRRAEKKRPSQDIP